MTDHTQDQDLGRRRPSTSPRLTLVSSRAFEDGEAPLESDTRPKLPNWAIYGLVGFYCFAIWSLAFWVIGALF
ncbi:MAG: hypothetical protein AAFX86_12865 [Pseudomonadota bacterium]